ncbi:MAG: hypothetical protein UZ08_BCD001000637 [Candidatus Parvibacillus calidus]|jgi:hypothetical protein|nr:MAG: hypothetical protein UZ08_BCD001000637 [Candidatus Parvibacillus calidus]
MKKFLVELEMEDDFLDSTILISILRKCTNILKGG